MSLQVRSRKESDRTACFVLMVEPLIKTPLNLLQIKGATPALQPRHYAKDIHIRAYSPQHTR